MKNIWTIGHSTRLIQELTELLLENSIELLCDVRRYPGSKRQPQFNKDELCKSLNQKTIRYAHMLSLGGRRKPKSNSFNMAWRNESFRGYADYMESEEFVRSVEELTGYAQNYRIAYMCSEALWYSCHRALISDYLKVDGWEVFHIMGKNQIVKHSFTQAARIVDGKLSYKLLL